MHRAYHRWYSSHVQRDMELLVFGHAGARVVVFPTRGGRFYDYENFGLVAALRYKIEQGWLQLFCIDSLDNESFYCQDCHPADRIARHVQFENYVREEVLPFTRTINPDMSLITHGCSMGGFHALNFALRHPALVGKVLALSGRYNLTQPAGDFRDLFDGYYDETIYFHTPVHFVPNIHDPEQLAYLRRMDITIVVGEADPFLNSNCELSQQLWNIGVRHSFFIWHGRAHKARHWSKMVELYL
jgi:esterase/lipase superfamily enzyme